MWRARWSRFQTDNLIIKMSDPVPLRTAAHNFNDLLAMSLERTVKSKRTNQSTEKHT